MEEVKICFKKRQYKNCSARCIQILNNLKDPSPTHPLYLAWMSFYAAASLEQIPRSLHINSTDKLPGLQQSIFYYEMAESYLQLASFSTSPTHTQEARQRSSSLSSSSSHSSSYSTFSEATPTGSPSPAPPPSDTTMDLDSSKTKPDKSVITNPQSMLSITPPLSEADLPSLPISTIRTLHSPSPPPSPTADIATSDFFLSRSLARYHKHLLGMQTQLRYHIGSVNAQIVTLQEVRKARRSNRPNLIAAFSAGGIDGVDMSELKKIDLKARRERLREAGWKRERFQGEKYRRLCEQALAELE